MVVIIPWGLIGDTVGTLKIVAEMAEKCLKKPEPFFVGCHREAWPIIQLLPKRLKIRNIDDAGEGTCGKVYALDLTEAFGYSTKKPCYMSQAYYSTIGWPVPFTPDLPELELGDETAVQYDIGLAPFARSLPDHQKWPRERWQALVDAYPEKRFVLYGAAARGDDPEFVTGKNVWPLFDYPLDHVARSIRDLEVCLVSVSTGPSHISFATKTPCVLLIDQGPFAKAPHAVAIEKHVTEITVDEVRYAIAQIEQTAIPA
jgi:ADP-heptose:LPS heptosyltransferase